MISWFYQKEYRAIGPVAESELPGLIAAGEIRPDTLVWRRGYRNWNHAAVTEVARLLFPLPEETDGAEAPELPPPIAPPPIKRPRPVEMPDEPVPDTLDYALGNFESGVPEYDGSIPDILWTLSRRLK